VNNGQRQPKFAGIKVQRAKSPNNCQIRKISFHHLVALVLQPLFRRLRQDDSLARSIAGHERSTGDVRFDRRSAQVGGLQYHVLVFLAG
jgi:hypothetical protein